MTFTWNKHEITLYSRWKYEDKLADDLPFNGPSNARHEFGSRLNWLAGRVEWLKQKIDHFSKWSKTENCGQSLIENCARNSISSQSDWKNCLCLPNSFFVLPAWVKIELKFPPESSIESFYREFFRMSSVLDILDQSDSESDVSLPPLVPKTELWVF